MDFILGRESKPKLTPYSLNEVPGAVARINTSLPEEEKIKSVRTYHNYLRKEDRDYRLPPLTTVANWYKQIHSDQRGLMDFILSESNLPIKLHIGGDTWSCW